MTVEELIEQLGDMSPDAEVRIMGQESYPFENNVRGLWQPTTSSFYMCSKADANDGKQYCDDDDCFNCEEERDAKEDEFKPKGNVVRDSSFRI